MTDDDPSGTTPDTTDDAPILEYRAEGWPVFGDFDVGLVPFSSDSEPNWMFERGRGLRDNVVDVHVLTPLGGFYAWYWGEQP